MRSFFDTSTLLKWIVREPGTDAALALRDQTTELLIAPVTLVEAVSAIVRLQRERLLTRAQSETLRRALAADLEDATVVAWSEQTRAFSVRVVERAGLKALEAVQLGSALGAAPELFITSDRALAKAAASFGLAVRVV